LPKLDKLTPSLGANKRLPVTLAWNFNLRGAIADIYDFDYPFFSLENGKFNIAYRELQNLVHELNEVGHVS